MISSVKNEVNIEQLDIQIINCFHKVLISIRHNPIKYPIQFNKTLCTKREHKRNREREKRMESNEVKIH